MCIHYQWCFLPENTENTLWVEKTWEGRRAQPRMSWAPESLGTVQISKRYLTAFFKYLSETQLHITQKWYTHCAGIISTGIWPDLFKQKVRGTVLSLNVLVILSSFFWFVADVALESVLVPFSLQLPSVHTQFIMAE